MTWPGPGGHFLYSLTEAFYLMFPFILHSEMSPDWQVSSYEEVMPGDMARVTVVSSALTIGACDCCVIG